MRMGKGRGSAKFWVRNVGEPTSLIGECLFSINDANEGLLIIQACQGWPARVI
jgi:ribosomal protein L16/L10AE